MQAHRTHTLTTTDGATIGGSVHGQGPPLVFVQGIIGDSCVHHAADHVPDARSREIPDAGHYAPLTDPEALAEALVEFFEPAQQPA